MPSSALRLAFAAGLLGLLAAASASPPSAPASLAGHWEDCSSFPGTCFGYRLTQDPDARVCGSLTEAPQAGDAPRKHGHIRGVVRDGLLTEVAVCGVESRSACPAIVKSNRRGLLLCGDELFETGGRRHTCDEWAAMKRPGQYRRVSASAFDQRFGAAPPSLCDAEVKP